MRITGRRQWLLLALGSAILTLGAGWAAGADDSYSGLPLTQVRFDHLIPMSYPTTSPGYDRLRQTISPLIDPGVAKIPITENLVHPLEQPLLVTSEGVGQIREGKPKSQTVVVIQPATERHSAPGKTGGQPRSGL